MLLTSFTISIFHGLNSEFFVFRHLLSDVIDIHFFELDFFFAQLRTSESDLWLLIGDALLGEYVIELGVTLRHVLSVICAVDRLQ